MKRYRYAGLISCLLVLLGVSLAPAQTEKADPTGTWKLSSALGGRTIGGTLKLERKDGRLRGVLQSMQVPEIPVEEIRFENGALSFRVVIQRAGQRFTMDYKGKLAGDTLKGTVDFDIAGRTGSLPFEGKRERLNLAGTWKIKLTAQTGQTFEPTLKIKQEGSKLDGEYVGVDGRAVAVQDLRLEGDGLSFQVVREQDGQKLRLKYRGQAAGETIKGKAEYDLAGATGTLEFEARRVKEQVNAAGTWKLIIRIDSGQVVEPTARLAQDGGQLSGVYIGERGETPIEEARMEGSEISFRVTRDRKGKTYTLRYRGTVSGDTLKGTVDYDFDDVTGTLDFEGKRVAEK